MKKKKPPVADFTIAPSTRNYGFAESKRVKGAFDDKVFNAKAIPGLIQQTIKLVPTFGVPVGRIKLTITAEGTDLELKTSGHFDIENAKPTTLEDGTQGVSVEFIPDTPRQKRRRS